MEPGRDRAITLERIDLPLGKNDGACIFDWYLSGKDEYRNKGTEAKTPVKKTSRRRSA
jgi:hypothetical protein